MRHDVSDARKAFERELQQTMQKPPQVLTERLIELVKEIHLELNRKRPHGN